MPLPDIAGQQNNFRNRTGGGSYDNYVSTFKIDHSFSENHKLSVTYSDQYNPRVIAGQGWGVDSPLEGSQSPKFIHDRTGRINYDWIIRPNLLNHFTIGVDRYNNSTQQVSQFQDWNQKLGISGCYLGSGSVPGRELQRRYRSPAQSGRRRFLDECEWPHHVCRESRLDQGPSQHEVRRDILAGICECPRRIPEQR